MSVFYERFDRHDHGQGLKAHATHYCAGCGHGMIHKYLAESIEELGIQDRTVLVSPVGCAVFMYYYFDVGNTQAAHGRAPAVAIGHKLANPESVVISYQGDGDLASIGLAEIFQAATLGLPISVIFVNNAIYGMTGGQMAPTSPMGLRTTTSPRGRGRIEGAPIKIAEQMALLDAPVYVERVALYDTKQRVKAHKAIKKALQLQMDRRGFSFVEVLAECPTHWKMTPQESERWVKEQMSALYPLGVKKEVAPEAWPEFVRPNYRPERVASVIGGSIEEVPRFCTVFPDCGFGEDVAIKLAGAGGDGAQTAALLLARAAIHEGFDGTHIPSYGPESRGGTSYADVHVAAHEVLSPAAPHPHLLVAFNAPSLARFGPDVVPGGVVLYDRTVIAEPAALGPGVRAYGIPFAEIARELGATLAKNIVALGALSAATGILPEASLLFAVRQALAGKPHLVALNEQAFAAGVTAAQEQTCATAS